MISKILKWLGCKQWRFQVDEFTRIKPAGRDIFVYQEGDHTLQFYAEINFGKVDRRVEKSSVRKWKPPHESESITEEKKQEILSKISMFFEMNKIRFEFY